MKQTEFTCIQCGRLFLVPNKTVTYRKKNNLTVGKFCSRECMHKHQQQLPEFTCTVCGKPFLRCPAEASKSENHFCSRTCAVSYNNTHKEYGTRRSKLEQYLEEQIRIAFPDLDLICNGKDAIGSELDFYFPQLRLAIELNGILHYEPIYGPDKLERIQANDQQKSIACHAAGIELCVIDTSSVSYLTKSIKAKYFDLIRDLVAPLLGRADGTNVQVP